MATHGCTAYPCPVCHGNAITAARNVRQEAIDQALRRLEFARERMDDDEGEDAILDVMDQLTGFCSPRMKL